jgi:hypothetical protein
MSKLKSTTLTLVLGLILFGATSTELGACAVEDGNPPDCSYGNAYWYCSHWRCPNPT